MNSKQKKTWPTKAVMQQIYEQHLWGGKSKDFYSGEGSHLAKIVEPYLNAVSKFFKNHHGALTVCDLGCGDFNIGHQLVPYTSKYIAIDIVETLIDRNKRLFINDNLEFQCLDISKDELPDADCVILRQVLQHLSNNEIQSIVDKLSNYKYLILTEHLPKEDFTPNKDKIANLGIRLKQQSGVNLDVAPFNFQFEKKEVLCNTLVGKGQITTFLYQIF